MCSYRISCSAIISTHHLIVATCICSRWNCGQTLTHIMYSTEDLTQQTNIVSISFHVKSYQMFLLLVDKAAGYETW